MKDPPRISVIVPVHNMEGFLPVCLDSILADGANKCSFEVIAVNDASTDGSDAILADYERRYGNLRVVRFKENQGVSAARNAGVTTARGDYVMFCDPDDAYVPGAVDYIASVVREQNPDVVFFKHAICRGQQTNLLLEVDASLSFFDMCQESSAVAGFRKLFAALWTWNGAFHRRLFERLRFNEDLWPSEDVLWGVQATCRCKTALVSDAVLYQYNQHPGSCLHRAFFSRVRSEITGIGLFAQEAKAWPYFDRVVNTIFHNLNFRAFIRPVVTLRRLPRKDREAAWNLLFEEYPSAFKGLVPARRRFLYELAFKTRSRFLVSTMISMPLRANCEVVGPLLASIRRGIGKFASCFRKTTPKTPRL